MQAVKYLQGIRGLAVALIAILTIVPALPGSVYVGLVLLRPQELANELIRGRADPFWWIILALIVLSAFIATVVQVRFLHSQRTVTKIVATIAVAFGCSAVLVEH